MISTFKEKLDLYMKAVKSNWRLSATKAAKEACKVLDETWETYKEACEAAEGTPEWKAVEKARKALKEEEEAYRKIPEYEVCLEVYDAVEEAEMAYRKTPEFKARNEAYIAYSKAHKKCRDEIDKVFKTMPTKFMGEEWGFPREREEEVC